MRRRYLLTELLAGTFMDSIEIGDANTVRITTQNDGTGSIQNETNAPGGIRGRLKCRCHVDGHASGLGLREQEVKELRQQIQVLEAELGYWRGLMKGTRYSFNTGHALEMEIKMLQMVDDKIQFVNVNKMEGDEGGEVDLDEATWPLPPAHKRSG